MVKAGDTVKKGQLLISGVLPHESGGGFCYAEGVVIGRTNDTVKVEIFENVQEKVKSERKIHRLSINLLGFDINIFKSYRNFDKEYDIINKKDCLKFFGVNIPISVNKEYVEFYDVIDRKLSSAEMADEALAKMTERLNDRLNSSTLLRISTEGYFDSGKYILLSDLTVSEDITKDLCFEAPSD